MTTTTPDQPPEPEWPEPADEPEREHTHPDITPDDDA
jgi:hypothetical protein